MAYVTQDDLVARFGSPALLLIAASAADRTQLDDDKIARAISDAESIVNLSCRQRYAIPLDPVPDEIVGITCALARYALYGNTTNIPQPVQDGNVNALALLKQIASGAVTLDATAVPSTGEPPAQEDLVEFGGEPATMTMESLRWL